MCIRKQELRCDTCRKLLNRSHVVASKQSRVRSCLMSRISIFRSLGGQRRCDRCNSQCVLANDTCCITWGMECQRISWDITHWNLGKEACNGSRGRRIVEGRSCSFPYGCLLKSAAPRHECIMLPWRTYPPLFSLSALKAAAKWRKQATQAPEMFCYRLQDIAFISTSDII